MTNQARCERTITNKETNLGVSVESRLREIGRGDEHRLIIRCYCLGMQNTTRRIQQLRAEYPSTIQTLQHIESATNPTNAQVIAAVKFLAKTLRLILKFLASQYRS